MKVFTYILAVILVGLSFFTFTYVTNNRFLSLKGAIKAATISRFVEPKEVKAIQNLLERLPVSSQIPEASRTTPDNIISPTLSPSGNTLAYIKIGEEGSFLGIGDVAYKNFKKLLPLSAGDWSLVWLEEKTLALTYFNNDLGSLFTFDIETGSLNRILANLSRLETQWSQDGQALLYSYSDPNKDVVLAYTILSNIGFETILPLKVSARKCTWSTDNQKIYCAVAKDNMSPQKGEKFVEVQLADSTMQSLKGTGVSKIKAENLSLSADNKYLFFKNSPSGNPYRLKIELH